jgi:predicted permease
VVLRAAGKGSAGGRRQRVLSALVVVEVAAATALAAGCALLAASLSRVVAIDPGVDPQGIVTLELGQPSGSTLPEAAAYYRRIVEVAAREPGFARVSVISRLPVVGSAASSGFEIQGRPNAPGEAPVADIRYVEPGALALLGVPRLAGRDVGRDDLADRELVVLVNETFVRRHFPGGKGALGQRVRLGNQPDLWRTVVGVVGDVHLAALELPVEPTVWVPLAQATFPSAIRTVAVVARASLPPAAALAALRTSIAASDALQAPARERTLEEALAASLQPRRFQTGLFTAFAAVASLLAAVGTYAALTFSVLARRDELAVRRALGSRPGALLGLVLAESTRLAALGAAIGAGLAVAGNRVVAASLVELAPWDPRVLAVAVAGSVLAAVAASLVPALRAARTSPLRTLRGG